VSNDILSRVAHGEVTPKPNIAELMGDRVKFVDGSVEAVDLIVYCTGYKVTFPFFDPDFISAPDNDMPLFRRVFHPDVANVFFLSLLQPLGAIMPLAEAQAEWVADLVTGVGALPPVPEMRRQIAAFDRRLPQLFVGPSYWRHEGGIANERFSISDTAEYGDLTRGPRIINNETRSEMRRILAEIRSGQFAKEWILENQAGRPVFNALRRRAAEHPIEEVGERLRSMMPWIGEGKARPRDVSGG